MEPSATDDDLRDLRRAAAGDDAGWRAVVERHRNRLKRLADFRLDDRLRSRIDPSDVVQEALVDAARRIGDYLANPAVPPFIWLRFLTRQQLATLHRHHLGREIRDACREVGIDENSGAAIACRLAADQTGPSTAAARAEVATKLNAALGGLDPIDREVLALRHFEGLSNAETAAALGLTVSAASKRYVRAAVRLREILADPSSSSPARAGP